MTVDVTGVVMTTTGGAPDPTLAWLQPLCAHMKFHGQALAASSLWPATWVLTHLVLAPRLHRDRPRAGTPGGSAPEQSEAEKQRELELIKQQYLGQEKLKKRVRGAWKPCYQGALKARASQPCR